MRTVEYVFKDSVSVCPSEILQVTIMLSPFDLRLKSAQLSGIFFNVEHDHIKYPRGLNTAVSLIGRRCCAQFWSP